MSRPARKTSGPAALGAALVLAVLVASPGSPALARKRPARPSLVVTSLPADAALAEAEGGAAGKGGSRAGRPPADAQRPGHELPADTRCALCHTVNGWDDVRFAHERTGYPLLGVHRKVPCASCHPGGYAKPVADRCAACHRDPHAQEFGLQCEGCHDENSWQTSFNADAHRRTNFPLTGRHALIPCTECHPNVRDRSFARAAVPCAQCHLAQYNNTASTALDHVRAGLSLQCQSCHLPWRFRPARFPDHDVCFVIDRGPHFNLRCASCHSTVVGLKVNAQSMCATGTAACTTCHEHECSRLDGLHRNRPGAEGYQCKDGKCRDCHRG